MSDEEIVLTHGNKESQCQNVNVTPTLSSHPSSAHYTAQLRWVDIRPIKAGVGGGVILSSWLADY